MSTNAPIPAARVELVDLTRVAIANEGGDFELRGVEPGAHHVLVRRIGYSPLDTTMTFAPGPALSRQIFLAPLAILDSVRVTASNLLRSFEENRRGGLGHFFTRAELEAQHVQYLAQAIDLLPGISIARGKGSSAWVTSRHGALMGGKVVVPDIGDRMRGAGAACYARVFLNDTEVYHGRSGEPLFDINSIPVDMIEAMEVYSAFETPAKYTGLNTCAVVVIWTRITFP